MIEKIEVGGRPAMAAYLTATLSPAEKDDAVLIKLIFDDGEVAFVEAKDSVGDAP